MLKNIYAFLFLYEILRKNRYFCTFKNNRYINQLKNSMKTILFLGNIGTGEIILIALVVLLLWGGKKIPELMKGLGKGVKSFKEGMNEIEKDIKIDETPKSEK